MASGNGTVRWHLQVGHPAGDQRVRSAVGVLVPAVRRADGHLREHGLDFVDSVQELLPVEVSTVQRLGTDGDGLDDVFISRDRALQRGSVRVERLIVVRPTELRSSVSGGCW